MERPEIEDTAEPEGNTRYLVRYEVYAYVYAKTPERADTLVQSTLYACLGAAEEANVPNAYALEYRNLATESAPF